MIISSCPTRISLGSADHSPYAEGWGGIALSIAIQKRVYVIIRRRTELERHKYRISYSSTELCNTIEEIKLPIVRGALQMLGIDEPLEIIYSADIPTKLGLGTSSSFALALIKGLYSLRETSLANEILAEKAYILERDILNEAGGFQDQYSCFGGINYLTGRPYAVKREAVPMDPKKAKEFEDHLLLIYTGNQANSHEVLEEQLVKLKSGKTLSEMSTIKQLVKEMHAMLLTDGFDIINLAYPMRDAWALKKKLSSTMTSPEVKEIEDLVRNIAPYAGYRLVGSGGGRGLMLVLLKPEDRETLIKNSGRFKTATVKIDWEGARAITANRAW